MDESPFYLNARYCAQNKRYYAPENEHRPTVYDRQTPKLMVEAGVVGAEVVGPYFFEGNVN